MGTSGSTCTLITASAALALRLTKVGQNRLFQSGEYSTIRWCVAEQADYSTVHIAHEPGAHEPPAATCIYNS